MAWSCVSPRCCYNGRGWVLAALATLLTGIIPQSKFVVSLVCLMHRSILSCGLSHCGLSHKGLPNQSHPHSPIALLLRLPSAGHTRALKAMTGSEGAERDAVRSGPTPAESFFQRVSHVIESGMNRFFSRLGELVATHPGKTLLIAMVGCVIGMTGFSVLETESRGDKLWLPTGTRAQEDFVRPMIP